MPGLEIHRLFASKQYPSIENLYTGSNYFNWHGMAWLEDALTITRHKHRGNTRSLANHLTRMVTKGAEDMGAAMGRFQCRCPPTSSAHYRIWKSKTKLTI